MVIFSRKTNSIYDIKYLYRYIYIYMIIYVLLLEVYMYLCVCIRYNNKIIILDSIVFSAMMTMKILSCRVSIVPFVSSRWKLPLELQVVFGNASGERKPRKKPNWILAAEGGWLKGYRGHQALYSQSHSFRPAPTIRFMCWGTGEFFPLAHFFQPDQRSNFQVLSNSKGVFFV